MPLRVWLLRTSRGTHAARAPNITMHNAKSWAESVVLPEMDCGVGRDRGGPCAASGDDETRAAGLQMMVPKITRVLPHDPDGKISGLHVEAMAIMFGAQFLRPPDPSNSRYVFAVEHAIGLIEDAHECWLPRGDQESAGRASAALAGFALELDRFGNSLRWLARTRKEPGQEHEKDVTQNFSFVLAHVEDEYETTFQQSVLQAWREVSAWK